MIFRLLFFNCQILFLLAALKVGKGLLNKLYLTITSKKGHFRSISKKNCQKNGKSNTPTFSKKAGLTK